MKRIVRAIFMFLIAAGFLCQPWQAARAQPAYRAHIDYVDSGVFPTVDVYLSVTDSAGALVTNLGQPDFAVAEGGRPITAFKVLPVENTKQPLAIALVMDASGSMATLPLPTALQSSILAAKSFLAALQPQDQVAAISYAESASVVRDFDADKTALGTALDGLQPGSRTNSVMFDAISSAMALLKNRGERPAILLVTDGRDIHSHATLDQVISAAQEAGVQVYAIGFGSVNRDQLNKLTGQTGGSAIIQPNASGLQAAFANILQLLRQQYQVEYTSSLPADNTAHDVTVTVSVQGAQVSASGTLMTRPGQVAVSLPYSDGQTVGGNVLFRPTLTGPASPAKLEIAMDGAPLTTVSAAPFEYTWSSTSAVPGLHSFSFKVTDQAGNAGQSDVRLNVQPPITVKISSPSNGATLQASSSIVASVTTLAGITISKVEIAVDGKTLKTLSGPPYQASWDLAGVPPGPHTIQVTAYDASGFSAGDQVSVSRAISSGAGWLVIPAILVVLAVVIPLSLRARRRRLAEPRITTPPVIPAAARPVLFQLHELSGVNPERIWLLGAGGLRLGRKSDENDIRLAGLGASRRHAVIRLEDGQYVIEGLSPNNPVLVNDQPALQPQALRAGDVIKLGDTTLRFEEQ